MGDSVEDNSEKPEEDTKPVPQPDTTPVPDKRPIGARIADGVTDAVGEKRISNNKVRAIVPWAGAGVVGVLSLILIEPLTTIGKSVAKGARWLVTGGGLFERIPLIGGLFTLAAKGIDAISDMLGYAIGAVAAFFTFKALESDPKPGAPADTRTHDPVVAKPKTKEIEEKKKAEEQKKKAEEQKKKAEDEKKKAEEEKKKAEDEKKKAQDDKKKTEDTNKEKKLNEKPIELKPEPKPKAPSREFTPKGTPHSVDGIRYARGTDFRWYRNVESTGFFTSRSKGEEITDLAKLRELSDTRGASLTDGVKRSLLDKVYKAAAEAQGLPAEGTVDAHRVQEAFREWYTNNHLAADGGPFQKHFKGKSVEIDSAEFADFMKGEFERFAKDAGVRANLQKVDIALTTPSPPVDLVPAEAPPVDPLAKKAADDAAREAAVNEAFDKAIKSADADLTKSLTEADKAEAKETYRKYLEANATNADFKADSSVLTDKIKRLGELRNKVEAAFAKAESWMLTGEGSIVEKPTQAQTDAAKSLTPQDKAAAKEAYRRHLIEGEGKVGFVEDVGLLAREMEALGKARASFTPPSVEAPAKTAAKNPSEPTIIEKYLAATDEDRRKVRESYDKLTGPDKPDFQKFQMDELARLGGERLKASGAENPTKASTKVSNEISSKIATYSADITAQFVLGGDVFSGGDVSGGIEYTQIEGKWYYRVLIDAPMVDIEVVEVTDPELIKQLDEKAKLDRAAAGATETLPPPKPADIPPRATLEPPRLEDLKLDLDGKKYQKVDGKWTAVDGAKATVSNINTIRQLNDLAAQERGAMSREAFQKIWEGNGRLALREANGSVLSWSLGLEEGTKPAKELADFVQEMSIHDREAFSEAYREHLRQNKRTTFDPALDSTFLNEQLTRMHEAHKVAQRGAASKMLGGVKSFFSDVKAGIASRLPWGAAAAVAAVPPPAAPAPVPKPADVKKPVDPTTPIDLTRADGPPTKKGKGFWSDESTGGVVDEATGRSGAERVARSTGKGIKYLANAGLSVGRVNFDSKLTRGVTKVGEGGMGVAFDGMFIYSGLERLRHSEGLKDDMVGYASTGAGGGGLFSKVWGTGAKLRAAGYFYGSENPAKLAVQDAYAKAKLTKTPVNLTGLDARTQQFAHYGKGKLSGGLGKLSGVAGGGVMMFQGGEGLHENYLGDNEAWKYALHGSEFAMGGGMLYSTTGFLGAGTIGSAALFPGLPVLLAAGAYDHHREIAKAMAKEVNEQGLRNFMALRPSVGRSMDEYMHSNAMAADKDTQFPSTKIFPTLERVRGEINRLAGSLDPKTNKPKYPLQYSDYYVDPASGKELPDLSPDELAKQVRWYKSVVMKEIDALVEYEKISPDNWDAIRDPRTRASQARHADDFLYVPLFQNYARGTEAGKLSLEKAVEQLKHSYDVLDRIDVAFSELGYVNDKYNQSVEKKLQLAFVDGSNGTKSTYIPLTKAKYTFSPEPKENLEIFFTVIPPKKPGDEPTYVLKEDSYYISKEKNFLDSIISPNLTPQAREDEAKKINEAIDKIMQSDGGKSIEQAYAEYRPQASYVTVKASTAEYDADTDTWTKVTTYTTSNKDKFKDSKLRKLTVTETITYEQAKALAPDGKETDQPAQVPTYTTAFEEAFRKRKPIYAAVKNAQNERVKAQAEAKIRAKMQSGITAAVGSGLPVQFSVQDLNQTSLMAQEEYEINKTLFNEIKEAEVYTGLMLRASQKFTVNGNNTALAPELAHLATGNSKRLPGVAIPRLMLPPPSSGGEPALVPNFNPRWEPQLTLNGFGHTGNEAFDRFLNASATYNKVSQYDDWHKRPDRTDYDYDYARLQPKLIEANALLDAYRTLNQENMGIDEQRKFFDKVRRFTDKNYEKLDVLFKDKAFWKQYQMARESYERVLAQAEIIAPNDPKMQALLCASAEKDMYGCLPALSPEVRKMIDETDVASLKAKKAQDPQLDFTMYSKGKKLVGAAADPARYDKFRIDPTLAFHVADIMTRDSVKKAAPLERQKAIEAEWRKELQVSTDIKLKVLRNGAGWKLTDPNAFPPGEQKSVLKQYLMQKDERFKPPAKGTDKLLYEKNLEVWRKSIEAEAERIAANAEELNKTQLLIRESEFIGQLEQWFGVREQDFDPEWLEKVTKQYTEVTDDTAAELQNTIDSALAQHMTSMALDGERSICLEQGYMPAVLADSMSFFSDDDTASMEQKTGLKILPKADEGRKEFIDDLERMDALVKQKLVPQYFKAKGASAEAQAIEIISMTPEFSHGSRWGDAKDDKTLNFIHVTYREKGETKTRYVKYHNDPSDKDHMLDVLLTEFDPEAAVKSKLAAQGLANVKIVTDAGESDTRPLSAMLSSKEKYEQPRVNGEYRPQRVAGYIEADYNMRDHLVAMQRDVSKLDDKTWAAFSEFMKINGLKRDKNNLLEKNAENLKLFSDQHTGVNEFLAYQIKQIEEQQGAGAAERKLRIYGDFVNNSGVLSFEANGKVQYKNTGLEKEFGAMDWVDAAQVTADDVKEYESVDAKLAQNLVQAKTQAKNPALGGFGKYKSGTFFISEAPQTRDATSADSSMGAMIDLVHSRTRDSVKKAEHNDWVERKGVDEYHKAQLGQVSNADCTDFAFGINNTIILKSALIVNPPANSGDVGYVCELVKEIEPGTEVEVTVDNTTRKVRLGYVDDKSDNFDAKHVLEDPFQQAALKKLANDAKLSKIITRPLDGRDPTVVDVSKYTKEQLEASLPVPKPARMDVDLAPSFQLDFNPRTGVDVSMPHFRKDTTLLKYRDATTNTLIALKDNFGIKKGKQRGGNLDMHDPALLGQGTLYDRLGELSVTSMRKNNNPDYVVGQITDWVISINDQKGKQTPQWLNKKPFDVKAKQIEVDGKIMLQITQMQIPGTQDWIDLGQEGYLFTPEKFGESNRESVRAESFKLVDFITKKLAIMNITPEQIALQQTQQAGAGGALPQPAKDNKDGATLPAAQPQPLLPPQPQPGTTFGFVAFGQGNVAGFMPTAMSAPKRIGFIDTPPDGIWPEGFTPVKGGLPNIAQQDNKTLGYISLDAKAPVAGFMPVAGLPPVLFGTIPSQMLPVPNGFTPMDKANEPVEIPALKATIPAADTEKDRQSKDKQALDDFAKVVTDATAVTGNFSGPVPAILAALKANSRNNDKV